MNYWCCSGLLQLRRERGKMDCCQADMFLFTVGRYQKLWKSYVKLRHLLANSPKVKQIDKQKLMQREVGSYFSDWSGGSWWHVMISITTLFYNKCLPSCSVQLIQILLIWNSTLVVNYCLNVMTHKGNIIFWAWLIFFFSLFSLREEDSKNISLIQCKHCNSKISFGTSQLL